MALPIVPSGAALVLSLFAAVLAWRRRGPVEAVASEHEPDRERVEVSRAHSPVRDHHAGPAPAGECSRSSARSTSWHS